MAEQHLALTAGWLDNNTATVSCASGTTLGGTNTTVLTTTDYCWPWVYHYPTPSRPIKLTLTEILKLRKAAENDKAIKAILAKFTDQIELIVDFG